MKARVYVETLEFIRAHGRQPRGRGSWAFCARRNACGGDADIIWENGLYAQARERAKARAQAQGVDRLWVLS
jgi:hypothetical protein